MDAHVEPSEEDFEDDVVDIKKESYQAAKVVPKISSNAFYGFTSPQTMKVQGYFKG